MYQWLSQLGVLESEKRRVFNCGVGMCAVVPAEDADAGFVVGRLVEGEGVV